MTLEELNTQIALGEDSRRQFKQDISNTDALAAEMAAFANTDGGVIFLGVTDDGTLLGLTLADVARLNQMISNAASQHIRSPLAVQTENIALVDGRLLIALTIPKGLDKPYFDRNGVIWLKSGADKRRVNSKEELRRLFQSVDSLHADEVPCKVGVEAIDGRSLADFLQATYGLDIPEKGADLLRLLQNMNLATGEGFLNLAGVLLFGKHPEWVKPAFIVKAVAFPGNVIESSSYVDSEDIGGRLRDVFDDTLRFIMRNLHKRQGQQSFNSVGEPEVPRLVFEELLVNALIHRDYFISAPIRVLVYANRIEIISPGHLPNNLTVEKVKAGNSNLRNPILASFIAKKLLPYRGLGSGILRALEAWSQIDFKDDREGCLFTVTVWRPAD
ncbi:ATP-dependent DNA helicase RecG [Thiothrix subterranea]|uniref:RNA-binding domain-containing protein n=1 Tax=Thiothrix subterranea TaxID=2735563 RepID=UPI00192C398C|nr:RNA-binding domain-containing protein [Thiothrix subterranea]QQZ27450.1 ATP-dependent DNA helicase RecG [Thiothrix subterranea]